MTPTPIPGLTVWELSVHADSRGWFKENWQRAAMVAAGLPDFGPVQQNVSFNTAAGTLRGIHAEPWDKLISVASGRIFGAWVDLREGASFGTVFTTEIDPSRAVFVPRGVANAYQTLEPDTVYTYLVNDHYVPGVVYPCVHPGDPALGIDWPIPLESSEMSDKDRNQPLLRDVQPVPARKTLVLGAGGQLGRALRAAYAGVAHVEFADHAEIDLTSDDFKSVRPWRDYDTVINAAAYTAVDAAETADGRAVAWAVNVTGAAQLARVANANRLTVVQVSSDYVFDGRADRPYRESDPMCPLGVYGQTKAAADQIIATVDRHYILRATWLIGDGRNFVRTMLSLAARGVDPSVVDDQHGRLTFTSDLARAIGHLIATRAPYGTYNITGSGPVDSWADIARRTFALAGYDESRITPVSTAQYLSGASGPVSPRPAYSVLDLTKIESTGYVAPDAHQSLADYVRSETGTTPTA